MPGTVRLEETRNGRVQDALVLDTLGRPEKRYCLFFRGIAVQVAATLNACVAARRRCGLEDAFTFFCVLRRDRYSCAAGGINRCIQESGYSCSD